MEEKMTGQKIEQAMELLMGIADDSAKMADKITKLEKQIAGFQALYEINKYMSRNLDLSTVINALEDIVVGVIGMGCCKVLLKEDILKNVQTNGVPGNAIDKNIKYSDMETDCVNELYIPDLKNTPRYGIDEGCLLALKLGSSLNTYGYIVAYNPRPDSVPPEKLSFFNMLVIQLCIYIENALLVQQLKEKMTTE